LTRIPNGVIERLGDSLTMRSGKGGGGRPADRTLILHAGSARVVTTILL